MNILVTGSSCGLGEAIADLLEADGHNVHGYDLKNGKDVLAPDLSGVGPLDALINCAGVNRIDWLEDLTPETWDEVMGVNAKGIYAMTRACLGRLKESKGVVVNIVSNASHIPMTCSLAYNASKGAAHIMTLQLARELTKWHGITVFGIAPNKLSGTSMSREIEAEVQRTRGWTKEEADAYQKAALLTGVETPPEAVADFLVFLLSKRDRFRYLSGTVIPYGA